MIILDTNVLSEMMRTEPDRRVVDWLAAIPRSDVFTTAVTQAEILYGLAVMQPGRRRDAIGAAAQDMFHEEFAGRVLAFDSQAASHYAALCADRRSAGRPIAHPDAQIAAIARSRAAIVATRNVADFEGCGVEVVNPWEAEG